MGIYADILSKTPKTFLMTAIGIILLGMVTVDSVTAEPGVERVIGKPKQCDIVWVESGRPAYYWKSPEANTPKESLIAKWRANWNNEVRQLKCQIKWMYKQTGDISDYKDICPKVLKNSKVQVGDTVYHRTEKVLATITGAGKQMAGQNGNLHLIMLRVNGPEEVEDVELSDLIFIERSLSCAGNARQDFEVFETKLNDIVTDATTAMTNNAATMAQFSDVANSKAEEAKQRAEAAKATLEETKTVKTTIETMEKNVTTDIAGVAATMKTEIRDEVNKQIVATKADVVTNSAKEVLTKLEADANFTAKLKGEVTKQITVLQESVKKSTVDITKKAVAKEVMVELKKDSKFTEWEDFKGNYDKLKKMVYVLLGVVGFLVFILIFGLVNVCVYSDEKKPQHKDPRQRRQIYGKQGGPRKQQPRLGNRPRQNPHPVNRPQMKPRPEKRPRIKPRPNAKAKRRS